MNTVLVWSVDIDKQVLTIPEGSKDMTRSVLDTILPQDNFRSKWKWKCLLGLLSSALLAILGSRGVFSRLHHVLRVSTVSTVTTNVAVHDLLNL